MGTEAPLASLYATKNLKLFGGQQAVDLVAFVACPIGRCRSVHWLNESDLQAAVVLAAAVPVVCKETMYA